MRILTITCTVNAGTSGTTILNKAGVNFNPSLDAITANNLASAAVFVSANADISLTKTAGASVYNIGDTVQYSLTVTNNGASTAAGFSVKELLPANLSFVSATSSFGVFNDAQMTWNSAGSILPATAGSNTATLTLRAKVNPGTAGLTMNNKAYIITAQSGNSLANDTANVQIQVKGADLQLTQSISTSTPTNLQNFTYTLNLTNLGPDSATLVQVGDTIPNGLRFISYTSSQGVFNNGIWSGINLANGQTATLVLTVRFEEPRTLTNTAYIIASSQPDGNLSNNSTSLLTIGYKTFAAGAAIINMGITPQTVNNGLRPYGLIYQLVRTAQVPVYWVINPTKSFVNILSKTDQIDQTINGVNYRSGFFVIPQEFMPQALSTINSWVSAYPGLTVNLNQPAFTSPIYNFITSFPNAVLDDQNGAKIRDAFYIPAGIPDSSYRLGNPGNLVPCDDIYAMPHADPQDWTAASGWGNTLRNFVIDRGYLWAACHAVSALESLVDLDTDGKPDCNFLSNSGLVEWTNHTDGTPPYAYSLGSGMFASNIASDPYMQFMGLMDGALQDGSEQIYIPYAQGWRPSTKIAIYDQDHPQVVSNLFPPGPAAAMAYGYAYGNPNFGKVMYQASHTIASGTVPEDVAAARAFGNFLLEAGIISRPDFTYFSVTSDSVYSGNNLFFSTVITGGTPPYQIEWSSGCGGVFSNPNNNSTQYQPFVAPPVTDTTQCIITCEVTDACGRKNFFSRQITIVPRNDLQMVKTVSNSTPYVGSNVVFTLSVTNNGPSNGTLVKATDTLPSGYTYVSHSTAFGNYSNATGVWDIGNLNAGLTATLTITATVNNSGNYLNKAAVIGKQFDLNELNNRDSITVTPVPVADLSVVKTVNIATPYMGNTVTFTMVVNNAGPSAAVNATLSDLLPSGYAYVSNTVTTGSYNSGTGVWTIGNMAIGSSQTITITATVLATGNYTNTATVTSSTADLNLANNTSSISTSPIAAVDVSVVKSVNNATPYVGSTITFTMLVNNPGMVQATNVVLNDVLPNGYSYVSSTVTTGTFNSGTGVWTIGAMNVGTSQTLTITATVLATGNYTNTATVTNSVFDINLANNTSSASTTPIPVANLGVTKTVSNATPYVGTNVVFTMVINNAGPSTAVNAVLNDLLPSGYNYVSSTVTTGTYNSGTGVWTIGNMALGASQTITITATVLASGNYTNTATVSSSTQDLNLANNTASASTNPVAAADVSVVKTVNNATPYMGNNVVFTMVVNNAGPSTAANVVLNDLLPAGYAYVSSTVSTGTYNSGTGVWTIGTMPINTTQTLTITATVLISGSYTNVATVSSTVYDPATGNNTSSVSTTPIPTSDLSVVKSLTNSFALAGSQVTFTIAVANNGYNNTGVILNDLLPSGYSYVSHTASTGTYVPGTGVWTLGNMSNGAAANLSLTAVVNGSGNYINSATASGSVFDLNLSNNTDTAKAVPYIDANPDINQTLMGIPVSGSVATNDHVLPGSTFTLLGSMSHGTLVFNTNGTYTYTPNPNFVGTDVVSYIVCSPSPSTLCDTTTLSIEVAPLYINQQNDVIAQNDNGTTYMNQALTLCVKCNDSDPNGNTIGQPTILTNPASGTVVVNPNGTVTYTPASGYSGSVSFTYSICDNGVPVACDTATVYVDVLPVSLAQNATYANDDAYNTNLNASINGDVSLNDTDPQGDAVSFTKLSNPLHGSVTFNANGTFTYTPTLGYWGPDNFIYAKCDSGTPIACDTATVYLTVNKPMPETNPDMNLTTVNVSVSGNLSTNDQMPAGSTYGTPVPVPGNPGVAVPVVNANGTYTFVSAVQGVFQYYVPVCEPAQVSGCRTELLTITVMPLSNNYPPMANTDIASTLVNSPVTLVSLANDLAALGFTLTPGSVTIVESPSHGTVTVNPANGNITYTPAANYVGQDTLTYQVCQNSIPVSCATAKQIITVLPVSNFNTTTAADDMKLTPLNTVATGNVKTNDSDPEGNSQTVTPQTTTVAGKGTLVLLADGSYTFTPVAGYTGPVEFVYTTCDNGIPQACDQATLHINVMPPDLAPNITVTPNVVHGITTLNITVTATELYKVGTSGLITILVPKDSRLSMTYNPAATSIGFSTVNNSAWSYNGSNMFYHIFTRNTSIPAGTSSTFGFVASFDPNKGNGVFTLTSTILSGSGGEVRTNNNSDSESVNYFND